MGMDVYGRNPAGPEGAYFRASNLQWPVLVRIITTLCPGETAGCKHTNDGDGLNSAQALALANAIEQKLRSGEVTAALRDPVIACQAKPPIIAAIEQAFGGKLVTLCDEDVDETYVGKFVVRACVGRLRNLVIGKSHKSKHAIFAQISTAGAR